MRGARIPYGDAEMAWLKANRMMVISDYHQAFRERFGRDDVTAVHLHSLRKRRGWKVGRSPERYKGRNRTYTDDEIEWLRENVTLETAECHRQFCERFDRPDLSIEKLIGLRKRYRFKTGRNGRFEKGSVSRNKGQKCPPGRGGRHPNAQRTQFKKGQVSHNHQGPGHESVDKYGYVWIVTDERNPWTGATTWRRHKHRWLWELANGPVPAGMALKCLGDKLNCEPSNWELVPKGLLPRLNGKSGRNYDRAPNELKPTILAVARLEHQVRERGRA